MEEEGASRINSRSKSIPRDFVLSSVNLPPISCITRACLFLLLLLLPYIQKYSTECYSGWSCSRKIDTLPPAFALFSLAAAAPAVTSITERAAQPTPRAARKPFNARAARLFTPRVRQPFALWLGWMCRIHNHLDVLLSTQLATRGLLKRGFLLLFFKFLIIYHSSFFNYYQKSNSFIFPFYRPFFC